ncbi:hypothetical protein [Marinobacterium lutimaris]|uniref:Uncharacterized protein n=1 Tax=Marinobacterium lutimaris TaxID=568106 RepID=A0A1H5XB61_9GAMM|nr:hypothetical protein [Marinobacterium lutimaris]SEG08992.1 hypothetical protein SAMN05444390_1011329 [Marinobacterium lutimaris]
MQDVFRKTFGGLTTQYYLRQFFFGVLVAAFFIFMTINAKQSMDIGSIIYAVIATLLYPYSRFVYESIVNFVLGDNVFFVNAIFMLIVKFFTIVMCWFLSIFIAPVGLAYLFYHHSKAAK